jgi:hypothetical protein
MDKQEARRDPQGYTTKVTRLGDGGYGCRVLRGDRVVSEGRAETREECGKVLKELLRWLDKTVHFTETAYRSRARRKA